MSAGGSEGPPQSARPDAEAGVTRRQFLIGGGIVVAGVAAAGAVGLAVLEGPRRLVPPQRRLR